MEEFWSEEHTVLASCDDTVFVVSPDEVLIQKLRGFCASRNLNLYEGEADSPDVIAIPYRIGVIDKEWLGEKAWVDWIDFLREVKGEQHDHVLIIVLKADGAGQVRSEPEREFVELYDAVCFAIAVDRAGIVKAMETCFKTGRIPVTRELSDVSKTGTGYNGEEVPLPDFQKRLTELMDRFPCTDPMAKVEIQPYFKWRMQAKWLLADYLGEDHPYSKEFSLMLGIEMDPYSLGMHITAGRGILEAVAEDIDRGVVQING